MSTKQSIKQSIKSATLLRGGKNEALHARHQHDQPFPQVHYVLNVPMASLCISAITEGELLFGLAKRPEEKRLQLAVKEFLRRVEVLPWDSTVSQQYGSVRAELASQGRTLAPLDLRIASHALSINATLVTNDQAFAQVPHLHLEDWTQPS